VVVVVALRPPTPSSPPPSGSPLDRALSFLPTKTLAALPLAGAAFVPPVSARAVGRAAVAAATDPDVPAGAMSVWDIKDKYGP
jgi:hypothetical protein